MIAKPPKPWVVIAAEANASLRRSGWGEREQVLGSVATKSGLDAQTVRRAVFAFKFIEDLALTHPDVAAALRTQGAMAAVEHLSRWSKYDRDGAVAASRAYMQGTHTVRSIEAAATIARRRTSGRRPVKGPDLRAQVERRLLESLGSGWVGEGRSTRRDRSKPVVDIAFRGPGKPIAVMIVGPYGQADAYAKRHSEWLLRAAGTAFLHPDFDIVLAIPEEADPLPWEEWVRFYGTGERIRLFRFSTGSSETAP